jgi:hypothetical protein
MSDLAATADHLTQALALVVGGTWAYLKYLRGRTFAYRADIALAAELVDPGGRPAVMTRLSVKNAGLSKLPLKPGGKVLHLYATSASTWAPPAELEWTRLLTTLVLAEHEWIEPGETVTEDTLLPLPTDDAGWLAVRVEAQVWSKRRRRRPGGTKWSATATLALSEQEGDDERDVSGQLGRRGRGGAGASASSAGRAQSVGTAARSA